MKKQVGIHEAKTRLSEVLQQVKAGDEFTITNRGEPIALLVPCTKSKTDLREVIKSMKEIRERNTLGGISIKELIESGRRY